MGERLTIDEKIVRARIVPDIAGREPFVHDPLKSHLALSDALEPVNVLKEAVMNRGNPDEILEVTADSIVRLIGVALTVADSKTVAQAIVRAKEVRNLFTAPDNQDASRTQSDR